MITYKLHLIRHGLTQGNLEGSYVGRKDLPVCPQGFEEMGEMVKKYEYPKVDAVYSSPLLRCKQTARFLYPDHHITLVEDLQEMDFGAFEGKFFKDLENDPDYATWLRDSMNNAPPGGEKGIDFAERISSAINQVFADMINHKIYNAAVVTHGGVIMTMLAVFGLPEVEMGRWVTGNCRGYTILLTPQMWMRDGKFEVYQQIPVEPFDPEEEEDDGDPHFFG